MKKLLLSLLCLATMLLSACSYVPTPDGPMVLAGGDHAYQRTKDGDITYVGKNTKSWRDAMVAAGTLGTGYFGLEAQKSADAVKSVALKEKTKQFTEYELTNRAAISATESMTNTATGMEMMAPATGTKVILPRRN